MWSLHLAIAFLSASHTLYKTKLHPSVSFKLFAFIVQAPRTKLKKNNENKQILNTTTFHALFSSQALIIPKYGATNTRDKKWEMSSSDNQQIMVLTQEKVAHSALFRS